MYEVKPAKVWLQVFLPTMSYFNQQPKLVKEVVVQKQPRELHK